MDQNLGRESVASMVAEVAVVVQVVPGVKAAQVVAALRAVEGLVLV